MTETKWIRQSHVEEVQPEFWITLRRYGFQLNETLSAELSARDRYAEIFISADNKKVALCFSRRRSDWTFPMSDLGSTDRTRRIDAPNIIKGNRQLAALLNEGGDSARIRLHHEGNYYVGKIEPTFCCDGAEEPAADGDIGVFRLFIGEDVVLIGGGRIRAEIATALAEGLPFDRYDYFLTETEIDALEQQARFLRQYAARKSDVPVLNKQLARRRLRTLTR
ncbi:hypothetical protein [Pelagovum sp. HNIBRBA483]|uniref:hypothetical protein n=1 Tax=Pelagovum sp. HNIBRBA483 TaxID=3233341 RepID=UPI0034A0F5D6